MSKTIKYFKKYTGKSGSIVDAMKAVGVSDPTVAYRTKIAKLNGITNYRRTAIQNAKLLAKLKQGKLIRSVAVTLDLRDRFLSKLSEYQKILKKYGKQLHYSYEDSESTFAKAKARLENGKGTGLTCVVPCRWALKDIGINPSGFYGKNGSFKHCYKGALKTYLKRIISGGAIGKTVEQAVKRELLISGDIITFEDATHTFVYTGYGFLVYDGGHAAMVNGVYAGIVVDYSKKYAGRKISEILRWKD